MNLVEYLARATEYLERHGIASPRLNAELLLAGMLDSSRLEIYTNFERELTKAEADAYRDLIVQRGSGRPLQYITGDTGFRGLTLRVEEGVFIPRPETEVLVEKALEAIDGLVASGHASVSVLDIGTGCGNVAVSIAAERELTSVTATDCDPAAAALCASNAASVGVDDRVQTAVGDLYEAIDAAAVFDLIVSNPPYVPTGMRDSMPAEVREFEPEQALFAGSDGMDTIRRIIAGAPARLSPNGYLVMEVDESHADEVGRSLEGGPWENVEVHEDLAGKPRVVRARYRE